jgi:hypothetical protein
MVTGLFWTHIFAAGYSSVSGNWTEYNPRPLLIVVPRLCLSPTWHFLFLVWWMYLVFSSLFCGDRGDEIKFWEALMQSVFGISWYKDPGRRNLTLYPSVATVIFFRIMILLMRWNCGECSGNEQIREMVASNKSCGMFARVCISRKP